MTPPAPRAHRSWSRSSTPCVRARRSAKSATCSAPRGASTTPPEPETMTTCVLLSLFLAVQTDTAAISRYIEAEVERQHIPGLSVAVLRGDRVVLSRGYGFANVELHVPASDSTVYQSGSMGKQFTAALVEMLVNSHLVRLDDSIVRWFPEGAGVWQGITVRHLLTHTSGVAEYTDSTFNYRKDYTEDELVKFAAARPLDFRPGERWSYSNTGYLLLGALIHRVTGRFYGDLLRDSVFGPLGMRDSRVISEADIVPNRAAGYRLERGALLHRARFGALGDRAESRPSAECGGARYGVDTGAAQRRRELSVRVRLVPAPTTSSAAHLTHRKLAGVQDGHRALPAVGGGAHRHRAGESRRSAGGRDRVRRCRTARSDASGTAPGHICRRQATAGRDSANSSVPT